MSTLNQEQLNYLLCCLKGQIPCLPIEIIWIIKCNEKKTVNSLPTFNCPYICFFFMEITYKLGGNISSHWRTVSTIRTFLPESKSQFFSEWIRALYVNYVTNSYRYPYFTYPSAELGWKRIIRESILTVDLTA